MARSSEARHAASSQLARSVSLHTRTTDGAFGHQSERNLSPRHGAGRSSVPRGGRGSRGSRGNRVWAPRGPGEAGRTPNPAHEVPEGSADRLSARGVRSSRKRGSDHRLPLRAPLPQHHRRVARSGPAMDNLESSWDFAQSSLALAATSVHVALRICAVDLKNAPQTAEALDKIKQCLAARRRSPSK